MRIATLFTLLIALTSNAKAAVCVEFISDTLISVNAVNISAFDLPVGQLEYSVSVGAADQPDARLSLVQRNGYFDLSRTIVVDGNDDVIFAAQAVPQTGVLAQDNVFFLSLYGRKKFCTDTDSNK